jgi:hypothetical protein
MTGSHTTDRIVTSIGAYSRPIHLDEDGAYDGCLLQAGERGP